MLGEASPRTPASEDAGTQELSAFLPPERESQVEAPCEQGPEAEELFGSDDDLPVNNIEDAEPVKMRDGKPEPSAKEAKEAKEAVQVAPRAKSRPCRQSLLTDKAPSAWLGASERSRLSRV